MNLGTKSWIGLVVVVGALAATPGAASAWFTGEQHENVLVNALGVDLDRDFNGAGASLRRGSMTTNGRTMAFSSSVPAESDEDNDAGGDVFVRDLVSGSLELISRRSGANGSAGNRVSRNARISASGRFVAFESQAWNLTGDDNFVDQEVYMRDRMTKVTQLISRSVNGDAIKGILLGLSQDGNRALIHTDDLTFYKDQCTGLFIRDVRERKTIPVGNYPSPTGASLCPGSDATLSGDGTTVAFATATRLTADAPSDRLPHVYTVNVETHNFTLVDRADGDGPAANEGSGNPVISGSGNAVLFSSWSSNLGSGPHPYALYMRNLANRSTHGVSIGYLGNLGSAYFSALSDDGSVVIFGSNDDGLVPEDQNDKSDIFVRNMSQRAVSLVHRMNGVDGGVSDEHNKYMPIIPDVSPDGSVAAFQTTARYLTPESTNFSQKVIARTLQPWTEPAESPARPDDHAWPVSKLRVPRLISQRQLTRLRGTADDDTRVGSVYLQVARRARGRCMWLKRSGAFTRRSCSKPVKLKVRGTDKWRYVLPRRLPPGSYEAMSIAVDIQGRTERIEQKMPTLFKVKR